MNILEKDLELARRMVELTRAGKLQWLEGSNSGYYAGLGPSNRIASIQRNLSTASPSYLLVFVKDKVEDYVVRPRTEALKKHLEDLFRLVADGMRIKSIDGILEDLDKL
jgi:hypothetical protein